MWLNQILQWGLISFELPNSALELNNSWPQPTLNRQEDHQEVKQTNGDGELRGRRLAISEPAVKSWSRTMQNLFEEETSESFSLEQEEIEEEWKKEEYGERIRVGKRAMEHEETMD